MKWRLGGQHLSPDKPPGCRHITASQSAFFTHCAFKPFRLIVHFQINFTSCLLEVLYLAANLFHIFRKLLLHFSLQDFLISTIALIKWFNKI